MMPSTKERARGQWHQILPALGIDPRFLSGRNCPCPICGGTDRFRFLDRQPGDGMWICNQCQPKPRPAIDLVIAYTGKPFREAARTIDDILGDKPVLAQTTSIRPIEQKASKYSHQKVWKRGDRIRPGDCADLYLRRRGVGMDIYAPCLRFSKLDWYYEDDLRYLPEDTQRFCDRPDIAIPVMRRAPAMLALVTNPEGKHVATHKTFLADDGRGKADISKPRRVVGKHGKGPTIRLMPTAPLMGIAEGVETAISAARLFRVPVWAVLNTYGIETFEPPPECQHLIVFADNDPHGASERAAESLCARLQFPAEIEMPDQPGADWNDVLLSENSR